MWSGRLPQVRWTLIAGRGASSVTSRMFDPSMGPTRLIFAFEAVIIGGLGDLWGKLRRRSNSRRCSTLGARINPYQILAGHIVFLAILTLRPQGFFAKTSSKSHERVRSNRGLAVAQVIAS